MRSPVLAVVTVALAAPCCPAAETLRTLIVDGQNNHANWPQTTKRMKQWPEDSGRFTVDVQTHAPQGEDPAFGPAFADYAVVISNFGHGAAPWPAATRESFEAYVRGGGGFVVVHAADNAFPDWPAYNAMIGLGGWGGSDEKSGPYVYFDESGKEIRDTPLGPGNDLQECVGFVTALQRGAEWAATGTVTLPLPDDFPSADATGRRSFVD